MSLFEKISGILAGIAMLIIVLAILAQVVLRPFDIYLPGAVELATYAMIAAVFLGLPYTFASRGHIRVTLFVNGIRGAGRKALEVFSLLVLLCWLAFMDYWTFDLVQRSLDKGSMTSGLIAMPIWIPQSLIPLGISLLLLSVIRRLVMLLRNREDLETLYTDPELD